MILLPYAISYKSLAAFYNYFFAASLCLSPESTGYQREIPTCFPIGSIAVSHKQGFNPSIEKSCFKAPRKLPQPVASRKG
jgi:hypothetical protein